MTRLSASMGPPPFDGGNRTPVIRSRSPLRFSFNGATAFRRWKRPARPSARGRSRRFNGATAFRRWKRPDRPLRSMTPTLASMGPPPFDGGNLPLGGMLGPLALPASMGPPPFDGGNEQRGQGVRRAARASMGPPPFDGGNAACPSLPKSHARRFNGATAFRRWKPRAGRRTPTSSHAGFNGATAFRRWKQMAIPYTSAAPVVLQWGHRLSTVETDGHTLHQRGAGCASMGPPPFDGGNRSTGLPLSSTPCTLQWGHRLSTVETRRRWQPSRNRTTRFNGATAFRRWKQRGVEALRPLLECASMGPPPFDGGNLQAAAIKLMTRLSASMGPPPFDGGNRTPVIRSRSPLRFSFNGATAFRRWKRPARPSARGRSRRFNGATAFRRWKPGRETRSSRRSRPRFNGATAFRRWKREAASAPGSRFSRRFNGATAFRRWKHG